MPQYGLRVIFFYSEQTASLFAACGSILSLILVLFFIPSFKKDQSKGSEKNPWKISEIFNLAFSSEVRSILIVKLICGIPIGVLQSMFSGILLLCIIMYY